MVLVAKDMGEKYAWVKPAINWFLTSVGTAAR